MLLTRRILKCFVLAQRSSGLKKCLKPCVSHFSTSKIDDAEQATQNSKSMGEIKFEILQASLPFVPKHGWTKESISYGANSLGLSSATHTLFPHKGAELVHHFYYYSNRELEKKLIEDKQAGIKKKISQFTRDAVEERLKMLRPYIKRWPEAMVLMANPWDGPRALQNLCDLVDTIWRQAGDTSVDMNWYTKRAILASIYKSTELFMLQDTSENHIETWAFLDRRMQDSAKFGLCMKQVKDSRVIFGEMLGVGFDLLLNTLNVKPRHQK